MYLAACAAVFAVAYCLNITWISVFYHRALAHKSIDLGPRMRRFVVATGPWITGMDPYTWVCMHRRHYAWRETPKDPHSPSNVGILGVLWQQLLSYNELQRLLAEGDEAATATVRDLDFGMARWMNKPVVSLLPYFVHAAIAIGFALATGWWLLAAAFWFGMMSHPIQGWLVNSFAHAVGSRNFVTTDNSRNTWLLGVLIAGEGYQNNHHRFPSSAKFGFLPHETDPGWWVAQALEEVGLVRIRRELLLPTPAQWERRTRGPRSEAREDRRCA